MIRGGHYPARASSIMRDEPDTAAGRAVGAWCAQRRTLLRDVPRSGGCSRGPVKLRRTSQRVAGGGPLPTGGK